MDWDLRTCARKGHVTYAVDEPEFRAKIEAATPLGDAWRCLRCGTYVLGPPQGHGPAEDAPVLLRGAGAAVGVHPAAARGRALGARARSSSLLGIAVLRLKSTEVSLKELFDQDLSSLQPFFDQIHFNVSDSGTIRAIQHALDAKPSTLTWIAVGLFVYGALQLVEGIGLWSLQRWGEYVAVVGTTLFIPLEVYELTEKVTWLRLAAFAGQPGGGRLPARRRSGCSASAAARKAYEADDARGVAARGRGIRGRAPPVRARRSPVGAARVQRRPAGRSGRWRS